MSKPDRFMKEILPKRGSRIQVWRGRAQITHQGEKREQLMRTEKGRIVNKNRHIAAMKRIKLWADQGDGTYKLFGKIYNFKSNPRAPRTREGKLVSRSKET